MSAANQLPTMSVADFLAWDPPEHEDRWELVDGIPHALAPASPLHGTIQAEAARLIGNHLAETSPACRVLIEPGVQPRVRAAINVRVPDLAVACAGVEPDDKLLRQPLVVIEILSPSNVTETWQNVWSYTTIPGVREILVLHTAEVRADLLRRVADGSWPADPQEITIGDSVALESIGFSAPLVGFYRTARPGL